MIVLLPPSETKRAGGDGHALRLHELSFPTLNGVRAELVDELGALASDIPTARRALGVTAAQDGEIARNAELTTAPTIAAIQRYTGVLYDALDIDSLRGAAAARARARLAVGSALFGLLRADDPVPADLPADVTRVDGRGCVLTPGLVNTHHHLYQWITRGLASLPGLRWIEGTRA